MSPSGHATIFLETGATAYVANSYGTTIFMKSGAHLVDYGGNLSVSIFLESGQRITWGKYFDTFYCSSLTFDYEQARVKQESSSSIAFRYFDNSAIASADGNICLRLLDILGNTILTREGTGELAIDLSALPTRVFLVEVRAGGGRMMRKILR
jgi:hypothetical protein